MVIQSTRRRLVLLVVVTLLLLVLVTRAYAQMIPSGCKGLTPSDLLWWQRNCWLYAFSPEHQRPFTGFVVR